MGLICANQKEEGNNDGLGGMNHVSYSFISTNRNLHTFYDPISILMDEFLEIQSHPWHDFISFDPYPSLIFKQQVTMASIFIYITYKPSLICCIINCNESSIDLSLASGCIGFMILPNTCLNWLE